jgi:hypothetical protein
MCVPVRVIFGICFYRHFQARQLDVGVESLHGDKDQAERTISMRKFSKSEDTAILVATDIASRGLDVKDIRTVINYDVAKNIETYVHRIGRTGVCALFMKVPFLILLLEVLCISQPLIIHRSYGLGRRSAWHSLHADDSCRQLICCRSGTKSEPFKPICFQGFAGSCRERSKVGQDKTHCSR